MNHKIIWFVFRYCDILSTNAGLTWFLAALLTSSMLLIFFFVGFGIYKLIQKVKKCTRPDDANASMISSNVAGTSLGPGPQYTNGSPIGSQYH